MKRFFITIILSLLFGTTALARTKSDAIRLMNGDRVMGEIIELDHGKLKVDTESMGMVYIEWNDIIGIDSKYFFQFELSDGARSVGKILNSDEQNISIFSSNGQQESFVTLDIVRIAPIEDTFIDRLTGSMIFGFSYTKASEIAQLNFAFNVAHR
ncbi:MAG: hypothetical protein DRQ47_07430, partial [Gammaproteobacteria bacterium]